MKVDMRVGGWGMAKWFGGKSTDTESNGVLSHWRECVSPIFYSLWQFVKVLPVVPGDRVECMNRRSPSNSRAQHKTQLSRAPSIIVPCQLHDNRAGFNLAQSKQIDHKEYPSSIHYQAPLFSRIVMSSCTRNYFNYPQCNSTFSLNTYH